MTRLRAAVTLLAAMAASLLQPTAAAAAAVSFAPPFGDHMVLQRDRPLRVWGRAATGAAVSVTVAGRTATATADADGRWRATLPALPPGGPFDVVATANGETAKLADVLVGDVWLCSGQSNMQFALKNATDGKDTVAAAVADPRLRLMTVPNVPSAVPTDHLDARWAAPTEAATADFSAVAIHFAVALHRSSPALRDVPIGLVNCSLGGSWVEYWIPAEPPLPRADPKPVSLWVVKPTQLYNGMVAPLAGLNLRGVLWYQGESNAARPAQYAALLRKLVGHWRDDFQDPALPFFVVQLPPFADAIDGYSFAGVREAQAQAQVATDPNVHLAVTLGTPDGEVLHPRHKRLVGDRLALLARRYALGEDVVADGPIFKAATPQGAEMRVTFDTHGSPLAAPVDGLSDFELAGPDGDYWAATAKVDGPDAVVVRSDAVPAPATVRYAWSAAPGATLANAAGLPAGPFRTDAAPTAPTLELQPAKPSRRFVARRYTATVDSSGWLTGLMADGHQMLSPNAQGGLLPLSGFGPFPLPYCTPLGPTRVAFDDEHLRFTYRFDPDAVHVDVHNGNATGESPVRCLLAADVTPDAPFAAGRPAAFAHRRTGLVIDGADTCAKSSDGGYDLQLKVPAGQTRTLTLRLTTNP